MHSLSYLEWEEDRYRSSGRDVVSLHLGVPPVVIVVTAVLDHYDLEVMLPMVFPVAFRPGKVSSWRRVWLLG